MEGLSRQKQGGIVAKRWPDVTSNWSGASRWFSARGVIQDGSRVPLTDLLSSGTLVPAPTAGRVRPSESAVVDQTVAHDYPNVNIR